MNLLIVDDEKQIREGMKSYIRKKEFKVNRIETAKDASEALRLSSAFKPDVLITDIVMPRIDGIELAARMKNMFPAVKIIMISGFKETNFMKSAFKLSVTDYIMKPIDLREFNPVLDKIIAEYEAERREEAELVQLKRNLNESRTLLRDRLLLALLDGEEGSLEEIARQMTALHIDLQAAQPLAVVTFHLESQTVSREEREELAALICSVLQQAGPSAVVHRSDAEIVGIVNRLASRPHGGGEGELTALCRCIHDAARRRFGLSMTIGIGRIADTALQLPQACRSSLEAVNRRFVTGRGSINVDSGDSDGRAGAGRFAPASGLVKALVLYMHAGDRDKTADTLQAILKPLYEHPPMSSGAIQTVRLEIASMFIRIAGELNAAAGEFDVNGLMRLDTLAEAEAYLLDAFAGCCERFRSQRRNKTASLISSVKALTEERYGEPLNVQYVADRMGVSPNYLSTLFKQETGMNYIDYLTKTRLEKSLDLMQASTRKISEIAVVVGYPDANYFAKLFKKYFGKSPSAYREDAV